MKLVITMSRRYGTGASQIAEGLSRRLHIPVYDKAIVKERMDGDSYESEASVIRELAKEPCIILGRCASEILKDKRNVFNIYICADKEDRIRRIMELENCTYEEAKMKLKQTDSERSAYYHEHTGKAWGDVNNYHMILDTSDLGIEQCTDVLIRYFEKKEFI